MIKHIRTVFYAPLSIMLVLTLAACPAATSRKTQPTEAATSTDFVFPAFVEADSAALPDEFKAVAASLAQRLAGASPQAVKTLVPVDNSAIVAPRDDFPLDGFQVAEVQILGAQARADDPAERAVALVLLFVDSYGRAAAAKALVDYRIERDSIALTGVAWFPISPALPNFETFLIPLPAAGALSQTTAGYRDFYDAAARAAVPRADFAERIAEGGEFVIAAFGKTRAAEGSRIALEVSVGPEGETLNQPSDIQAVIFPGDYPVLLYPAELQAETDAPLWVRLLYTPGAGATGQARQRAVLVDVFPLAEEPAGS